VPSFYVLQCGDGSLYSGWTTHLSRRFAAHARGGGAKYTRSRLPVQLLAWCAVKDRSDALRLEERFKRLERTDKLALLRAGQAFGMVLHKAPYYADAPQYKGSDMAARTAPVGEELRACLDVARVSRVRISTEKGDMVFTFYPDDAPQHCAAFAKLAQSGFYDGLAFHRVEPGYVVQGGDPSGDGSGGPGYNLRAEFNARPHVRGTVAMARAASPHSAGSQFYICLDDARFLDKQYTVFGQVTDGFETLDAIRPGDVMKKVTLEPAGA